MPGIARGIRNAVTEHRRGCRRSTSEHLGRIAGGDERLEQLAGRTERELLLETSAASVGDGHASLAGRLDGCREQA